LEHLTEPQPRARLLPRPAHQLRIEQLDRLEPLGRIPCAPHAHKLARAHCHVELESARSSHFLAVWCELVAACGHSKHDARCSRACTSRAPRTPRSRARDEHLPAWLCGAGLGTDALR